MANMRHVVWKGVEPSPALVARVEAELNALERQYERLVATRVVLDAPHRHQRHGSHFQVKIELSVPGRTLAVTRDPEAATNAEDAYAAIGDAFDHAHRKLQRFLARREPRRAPPRRTAAKAVRRTGVRHGSAQDNPRRH